MALEPRGWGLLFAAVVLGVAWWFIRLKDIWYPMFALAALVVIGLVLAMAFPLLTRFTVDVTTSDPTPTAGDPLDLIVFLSHRMPVALEVGIVVDVDGEQLAFRERVRARERLEARLAWTAPRRGPVTIRVTDILTQDPLGIARGRLNPRAATEILVLPRLLGWLEPPPAPIRQQNTGNLPRRALAGHPEGALRQYRTGDALRQIHWKQSARQGELLVNLPEEERERVESLLLFSARDAYLDEKDFELAVSAAATVASAWLAEGSIVHLMEEGRAVADRDELLRTLAVAGQKTGVIELDWPFGPVTAVTGRVSADVAETLNTIGTGVLFAAQPPATAGGWYVVTLASPEDIAPPVRYVAGAG